MESLSLWQRLISFKENIVENTTFAWGCILLREVWWFYNTILSISYIPAAVTEGALRLYVHIPTGAVKYINGEKKKVVQCEQHKKWFYILERTNKLKYFENCQIFFSAEQETLIFYKIDRSRQYFQTKRYGRNVVNPQWQLFKYLSFCRKIKYSNLFFC